MRINQAGTSARSGRTPRRRRTVLGVMLTVIAVLIAGGMGAGTAAAQGPIQHGISFTKGCDSPTQIGQPYVCNYTIRNNADDAQDTLKINGFTDVVLSAGGAVSSGNV